MFDMIRSEVRDAAHNPLFLPVLINLMGFALTFATLLVLWETPTIPVTRTGMFVLLNTMTVTFANTIGLAALAIVRRQ